MKISCKLFRFSSKSQIATSFLRDFDLDFLGAISRFHYSLFYANAFPFHAKRAQTDRLIGAIAAVINSTFEKYPHSLSS